MERISLDLARFDSAVNTRQRDYMPYVCTLFQFRMATLDEDSLVHFPLHAS